VRAGHHMGMGPVWTSWSMLFVSYVFTMSNRNEHTRPDVSVSLIDELIDWFGFSVGLRSVIPLISDLGMTHSLGLEWNHLSFSFSLLRSNPNDRGVLHCSRLVSAWAHWNDHSLAYSSISDPLIDPSTPSGGQESKSMTSKEEDTVDECPFFRNDPILISMVVGVVQ
jgi:hypothetical protein